MTKEQLKEIANELQTQDNRATADPLFCVFEKEQICGMDPDYTDTYEWVLDYDSETIGDADDLMRECELTEEQAENDDRFRKGYYIERDRFVNAHFTEKAALEHIRINGHNLRKPFVYVTSLFRCNEMVGIRNALLEGKLCMAEA